MKSKKKIIFNIFKYGFLFLFFLYGLMISYNVFFGDTIVNYGFSYALLRGEIPYNDFNLVIPLFSPFVYALSLIFYKNIISIYVFQAILLVVMFRMLEELLKGKVYLLLPFLFIGYPICLFSALFPGYNFILLFLIVLLLLLEERNANDYLIGFILGLCIVTKHTIGLFLFLPSLIYIVRDRNTFKVLKRVVGGVIPCLIFLVYLIVSRSFSNFINLCCLGIFDFAEKNTTYGNGLLLVLFVVVVGYVIYRIIKNPRDIINYYALVSGLFVYPLLDNYHISYFLILVIVLFLYKKNTLVNVKVKTACVVFCIFLNILWTVVLMNLGGFKFYNYEGYSMRLLNDKMRYEYSLIDKYVKNSEYNVVLLGLGTENYFYKVTNNKDITYFDLPNYGNYGYNSYKMMTLKIDEVEDTVFLINMKALKGVSGQQYYREIADYIIENCEFLENVGEYRAYYKK